MHLHLLKCLLLKMYPNELRVVSRTLRSNGVCNWLMFNYYIWKSNDERLAKRIMTMQNIQTDLEYISNITNDIKKRENANKITNYLGKS